MAETARIKSSPPKWRAWGLIISGLTEKNWNLIGGWSLTWNTELQNDFYFIDDLVNLLNAQNRLKLGPQLPIQNASVREERDVIRSILHHIYATYGFVRGKIIFLQRTHRVIGGSNHFSTKGFSRGSDLCDKGTSLLEAKKFCVTCHEPFTDEVISWSMGLWRVIWSFHRCGYLLLLLQPRRVNSNARGW